MTHPSFYKVKRYLATLDTPLAPLHQQMISDFGVDLPDGHSQLTLTRQYDGDNTRWIVEMSEGRNRQIRRMAELVELRVVDLMRVRVGPLKLGDLPEGKWRPLSAEERAALITASKG